MGATGDGRRDATIYDVAKVANVAPSTVSRAFSRPGRLNGATEQRIREVAERLGYQPNRTARGLSTGRTHNLGMLAPNVANPFFAEFLRSFQQAAAAQAYDVIFIDTGEEPAHELIGLRTLSSQSDGIVLCAPRAYDRELLAMVDPAYTLVINHELPDTQCVLIDSREALAEVFAELERLGHRRLVYARGPVSAVSDRIRRRIVRRQCAQKELELFVTTASPDDEQLALTAVDLASESGASAILAHSDIAAIWVIHVCHERGLRVPEDVSVIGHDGIAFGRMMTPPLSTIDAHITEVAATTARRLIDLIGGLDGGPANAERVTRITADLKLRGSLAEVTPGRSSVRSGR